MLVLQQHPKSRLFFYGGTKETTTKHHNHLTVNLWNKGYIFLQDIQLVKIGPLKYAQNVTKKVDFLQFFFYFKLHIKNKFLNKLLIKDMKKLSQLLVATYRWTTQVVQFTLWSESIMSKYVIIRTDISALSTI